MTGRPRWWSQPVAAEGSIASQGIRRQLGKPNLDPLTVLIRETAQNSCDAALPGEGDVEFAIRLHQLSGNRLRAWTDYLLPEPEASGLDLAEFLGRGPMIMTISDRGTTGLGGPLRADQSPLPGERPDFVNFVRNVGEPKGVGLGGGSYGFGKGILYTVSRCHLVVVDSICNFRGRRQRRLIGAALGDGYTHQGRRFTGRHWLGPIEDDFARPLLDDEADDIAQRLGLPRFDDGATGTTLVVVDVDLGRQIRDGREIPRDPDSASEFIVSTMLWNLWPRMLSGRESRLVCSVRRDGFSTPVPDPESVPELAPFVEAYRSVTVGKDYQVPPRARAPREIGRFALKRSLAPMWENPVMSAAAPFEGRAHHCARMRQADLVVDYFTGEPGSDEMTQYGAVFRASAEADPYFVESEPPTHDDWVLSGLSGTARGVVQLASGFVREQLREATPATAAPPRSDVPLAFLANKLAGLMTGHEGDRATATDEPDRGAGGRGGGAGRRPSPRFTDGPALVWRDGSAVLTATVQIPQWDRPRTVRAEPLVVLDSGTEPASVDACHVIGWHHIASDRRVDGDSLLISDPETAGEWRLDLTAPRDVVVRVRLDTKTVEASS